jgi:5-methylcytosine-specific restriction enzyme subunit McrC
MLCGKENSNPDEKIAALLGEIDYPGQPKNGDITKIKAFGLNRDEYGMDWFSYYIGLDYLDDKNEHPLYVSPKIDNLDYHAMFRACLESPETAPYMSRIYDIRIDKPFIKPPSGEHNDFIPLIMYQYLVLLSALVKKPLIKSYINKTENLKAKIKGKILIGGHIKKNIAGGRNDRMLCTFDEYSKDCLANRLLHSAYKICRSYSAAYIKKDGLSFDRYEYLESFFTNVGYITHSIELNRIKTNPLFLEYKDALRLAKIICRCKSYHENMNEDKYFVEIPPYIIDMSKLFELYILTKLKQANLNIKYQESGNYGEVDFLEHEGKIIIDTKYKKIYDGEGQNYNIEDIRQVSGYARDKRLLKKLYGSEVDSWKNKVPRCLIIYPDKNGKEIIDSDYEKLLENNIEQFNEFYKYGIRLPERDAE